MPALNKETFLKKVIKRKKTSNGFQPFFLLARVRCYKRCDRKVFPEGQQEEKEEEEMEGMKAGRQVCWAAAWHPRPPTLQQRCAQCLRAQCRGAE